jgi:hypothetical protein
MSSLKENKHEEKVLVNLDDKQNYLHVVDEVLVDVEAK